MLPAASTRAGLATTSAEGKGRTRVDGAAAPTLFDGDGPREALLNAAFRRRRACKILI
jgi:hypothetical protein